MKYIIDIPDNSDTEYTYDQDTKELKFPSPRIDPTSFMGLEIVLTNVIPYTEPDRKTIEDEVWAFAKKVRLEEFIDEEGRLHGYISGFNSYSEAKAKYEAWKKQKDKIRVGDEVIYNSRTKAIVLKPETKERYGIILTTSELATISVSHDDLEKTGRHFDEIEELLKKMGKESYV